jgi:hypothetical protein
MKKMSWLRETRCKNHRKGVRTSLWMSCAIRPEQIRTRDSPWISLFILGAVATVASRSTESESECLWHREKKD